MRLLVLLALSLAVGAAQLHIYVSQGVLGAEHAVRAVLEETIINNSSTPRVVGNVTVPPFEVVTIEREVSPHYPIPVIVTHRAVLINGTLVGGRVVGDPPMGIKLTMDITNLLPVDLVSTVTVQVDGRVALLYDVEPANVIRVGSLTVYNWALVLRDRATFNLLMLVRDLGDWGALRPTPIRVSVRIDFDALVSYQRERLEGLEEAAGRVEGFLTAVGQVRGAMASLAGNLSLAARLLNVSSALAGNASSAINVSLLLVESLRRQLSALGAALRGMAAEAERIRVLAEEQYAAMNAMADLFRVQAEAIRSYRATLNETAEILGDASRRVYALSTTLRSAAYRLGQIGAELAALRDSVLRLGESLNLTGPAEEAAALIGSAIRVVRSSEEALMDLVEELRDVSALLRTYSRDVSDMEAALRGTEEDLRSAAESAELNATVIRRNIASAVDGLQRGLNEAADALDGAVREAEQLAEPVKAASRQLVQLAEAAGRLAANASALALDVRGELPLLGAAESAILDAKYSIEEEAERILRTLEELDRYRSFYPVNAVTVTYILSLPMFLSPKAAELGLSVRPREVGAEAQTAGGFAPYAAGAATSTVLAYLAYAMFRRARRTRAAGNF